jgi:hypothetical protein
MPLEYFQLIDRIVELDLAGRAIKTEARFPEVSTIFEGHWASADARRAPDRIDGADLGLADSMSEVAERIGFPLEAAYA